MNTIDWITGHGAELLQALGAVVALATLIVKLTPTPADDTVLRQVIRVLSALSLCNADGSFVGKREE